MNSCTYRSNMCGWHTMRKCVIVNKLYRQEIKDKLRIAIEKCERKFCFLLSPLCSVQPCEHLNVQCVCTKHVVHIYFQPSDKFDNPYLIIPWVTKDNSEHLCALVSRTCFRALGTLLYLNKHCPFITNYWLRFLLSEFYNNFTKMLTVSIDLQHSYCNIVFLIKQFILCLYFFVPH